MAEKKPEEVQVMFMLAKPLNKRMRKLAIDRDMSIKELLTEAVTTILKTNSHSQAPGKDVDA